MCTIVSVQIIAQDVEVDVLLNVNHFVGDISTFDRKKFINLHASLTENDWTGDMDKMDYVINDLDVYLGRDNGNMGWYMNQSYQDPSNPGFVSPVYMASQGTYARQTVYGVNKADRHAYEDHADMIFGGQEKPFWPGSVTTPYNGSAGWEVASGAVSGDYMGRYFNEFFRDDNQSSTFGHPRPKYMEIINEPLYGLVDEGNHTPTEVFQYHNDVADAIRAHTTDVMIGGYTTAFPIFEENDFQRWEDRMKLFYDMSGAKMDFISVHLYDFNKHHYNNGANFHGPVNHKGSRVEATLDMMEHYSQIKFDSVKPFFISEYGGRDHSLEWRTWSAIRDWQFMKSFSPLTLSFMERPDIILKAIPFIMNKCEWQTGTVPHPWRLMRQENEPASRTGDWVFTELIKYYELWSDVNGKRLETNSSDLDILVDAYAEGTKAYVIVSNLNFAQETIKLSLTDNTGNSLSSVSVKHLYSNGTAPVLSTESLTPGSVITFNIGAEATAIFECTYTNPIQITDTLQELKYYAETYYQPINSATATDFAINGVDIGNYGKAKLRIGLGRDHSKSLQPSVTFNGYELDVPDNYRGDDQNIRDRFFGLIEVDVPYSIINANNDVSIGFYDDGGHISSLAMQVYSADDEITRPWNVSVTGINVDPETIITGVGQERQLTTEILPSDATDYGYTWSSDNTSIATVDAVSGKITGVAVGSANVIATSSDGNYKDTCVVTVQTDPVDISVESISLSPATVNLTAGHTTTLTATILPIDATNKNVTWSSSNTGFATVSNGTVTGVAAGTATITVTSVDDPTKSATSTITVTAAIPASLALDNPSKYTSNTYLVGGLMHVSCNYHAGSGNSVSSEFDGVEFRLRELDSEWGVVKDYIATDESVIGKENGTASASISLDGAIPNTELPDGNFYYLFVRFRSTNGTAYNTNAFPITIATSGISVSSVSVSPTSGYIDVSSTIELTETVLPANAQDKTVSWSSSNTGVATVSTEGVVTGVAEGEATITVTTNDGSKTANATINVVSDITDVTGVSISPASLDVAIDGSASLLASIAPIGATNKNVSWSSDNEQVATIDDVGMVTGVEIGSTTVTVTTDDGGYTATAVVNVINNFIEVTGVKIEPGSQTMAVGKKVELQAIITPSNASNPGVLWSSNNEEVAVVNSNGKVLALSPGTAKIMVTTSDNQLIAIATITVEDGSSTADVNWDKITLYPNPARNTITVRGIGETEYIISIYGLQGVEYLREEINGITGNQLSIESLPNGIYILNIRSSNTNRNFRFIKNE